MALRNPIRHPVRFLLSVEFLGGAGMMFVAVISTSDTESG